jgi:uroporphyrinogen decarboxylase
MASMTSRERVRAALDHREPDRVPVCVGGTGGKITESRIELLKQHFGIVGDAPKVLVGPQLMRLDDRVLDALGTDVRYLYMRPPADFRQRVAPEGGWFYDWGLIYREHGDGMMYEYTNHPLAGATLGSIDDLPLPDAGDPARWTGLRAEAERLYHETDYALVAYRPKYSGLFELSQILRGTEQLLTDMVLQPEFAEALFWKVEEGLKALYLAQLDAVGEFVEWVEMGDDLGTQAGPLISPATYRALLKPAHADLIRAIKTHSPNVRVMYHTCGSIRRFLPDLIEIGVDILNPIQVAAKGMDPAAIKAEFGDRLCFLGGVDAQHLLPAGRPEEVREEIRLRIRQMAPGGGYILAPSHNIGDDVPLENILAFFEAWRDYAAYPLQALAVSES